MEEHNNPSDTKQRLIDAGVRLFAMHGYEATSTRMIAKEANVNVATIAFHFKNKEGFYKAVLDYVAQALNQPLRPLLDHEARLRSANSITPEVAWVLIEEYVDAMLDTVVSIQSFEHAHYLSLLYLEQLYHPGNSYPITRVICKEMESVLTRLLQDYRREIDIDTATTISRIVSSSIVAFGEHPMFIRRALGLEDDALLPEKIVKTTRAFILNSIRSFHPQSEDGKEKPQNER